MSHAIDAWRARLRLDASALGLSDVLRQLDAADELDELDELDQLVEREYARRPAALPSVAQLAALEAEAAAWVQDVPALADELEQLMQLAPVSVREDGVILLRDEPDTLDGVRYRYELEQLRDVARDGHRQPAESGWVGPFAQPADIQRAIDDTQAEVESIGDELERVDVAEMSPAQRDAVEEWRAWEDAWGEWRDSEPSTWWGGTLTELDAWQAQLRDHRERLEVALAAPLSTPAAERERDPITRAASTLADVAGQTSTGLGLGLGIGAVVLGGLYLLATGRVGRRRAAA